MMTKISKKSLSDYPPIPADEPARPLRPDGWSNKRWADFLWSLEFEFLVFPTAGGKLRVLSIEPVDRVSRIRCRPSAKLFSDNSEGQGSS